MSKTFRVQIKQTSHPVFDSQVCVIVYVDFRHGNAAFLFRDSFLQPRPEDLTGTTPPENTQTEPTSECSYETTVRGVR